MPAPFRQQGRIAQLETPLGKDELVLARFEAREGLNELFEIRVEALSRTENIDFGPHIGHNFTLICETIGGGKRHFDGWLAETQWLGWRDELDAHAYRLVLRPWFWFLSHGRNCLIFRDMSAREIIEKVLDGHPIDIRLTKNCPELEYCVQYRESDMDFVRRLMEDNGISFFFAHSQGQHRMVLVDDLSRCDKIDKGTRPYIPTEERHQRQTEHFHRWEPGRRFTAAKVTLRDYDFKKPNANMEVEASGDVPFDKFEVYDYPGEYVEPADGKKYAEVWRDAERGEDGRHFASGDCASCFPGALVTLEKHPDAAQNTEYLALSCVHSFENEGYRSQASAASTEPYRGSYELIRSDQPYAPPQATEKPLIHGPQTAKVIGDGEIDLDEHGRILVRFHWDRKSDQSRRCRIAQVWSGKQWGGMFIPRVGMEAVVEFLDGDPDQPLVVGTVYNGENTHPFPLTGKVAGFKSRSTPNSSGYNQLSFDDSAGSELFHMHAEKDLDAKVKNNETRKVGTERTTNIGINDTLKVGSTLKIEAGMMIELTVGPSKITMTPVGIKMEAMMIEVSATGLLKTSGVLADHQGAAIMTIKGGIVLIN